MSRTAALFGGNIGAKNSNLIELRAGKMVMKDNWVVPDQRPGLLYLHQSRDGLMHFCWKDRSASQAEDDILVFPEEAVFLPVKKCITGRVYVLKYKSGKNYFYWLQEPNAEKDDENIKTINRYFNEPPSRSTRSGNVGASSLGSSDMQDLFGNLHLNQPDLLALLSMGMGSDASAVLSSQPRIPASTRTTVPASSSAATEAVPAATAAGPKRSRPNTGNTKFKLEDIQNIFSLINTGSSSSRIDVPILGDVLTSENLDSVISNNDAESLSQFLPEDSSTEDNKKKTSATISSPFFKAAVRSFSSALQSGEMDQVVNQFNLGPDANTAALSGDLVAFAEALETLEGKESQETSSSSNPEPMDAAKEDEPMEKN